MAGRLFLFSPVERMIAWRYLRPRRREGFLSVIAGFSFLGILLGVATLIIVMSVMNGFRKELQEKVLGFNGHIVVGGVGGVMRDFDAVAEKLRQVKGVVSATPLIEAQAFASANQVGSGAFVRGIKPGDLAQQKLLAGSVRQGKLDEFTGEDVVLVGERLARQLGVNVGERITLFSPTPVYTPMGTVYRQKAFRVVATFNVGMSEYDRIYVYMPLEGAQPFFNYEESVSGIEVMVENPDQVENIAQEIQRLRLPNVRILTWQDRHATFFQALEVERVVMFLILSLIILVAAFNIVSSLIMLVKDKGQAIAILRTMGATRGTIMRLFMLSGATIGIVGTLAGVGLGLLISYNVEAIREGLQALLGVKIFDPLIYFLSRLPAVVDLRQVLQVGGMGIGLSLLATLYPSWKASRLDPVEALRNE